ncbi:hypothetical protein [Thermostaphylospora chromogena]|uniref:Uncharacterized protein n=1 Tax=Thermostaphylospora chromogena TaxID=35622 RepID=A0A1H1CR85_9ACTN|nr:hypothetical protein [Thermostaphylospora chromogena]SDQ66720.1 hypothetical protein SAMN04489764_1604 [Thermostaphylospora chromogena]
MEPVGQPVPSTKKTTAVGCASAAAVFVAALIAVAVDYVLVVKARTFCDAGAEPQHLFALTVEMAARLLLAPPICVGIFFLVKRLGRALPGSKSMLLAAGVVVACLIVLIIFDFATIGTLDGYPGDGSCPSDNTPPWWPSWLPS